jgi:hypothetical protein
MAHGPLTDMITYNTCNDLDNVSRRVARHGCVVQHPTMKVLTKSRRPSSVKATRLAKHHAPTAHLEYVAGLAQINLIFIRSVTCHFSIGFDL